MKILLDTNAYVRFRQGHQRVMQCVRDAERILFSAVVAGELFYGYHHGSRGEENVRRLLDFVDHGAVSFVPVDLETGDRFGRIAAALRRAGTPIPTNDIWIAAHAMQTGATLVTYDTHFQKILGLAVTTLEV